MLSMVSVAFQTLASCKAKKERVLLVNLHLKTWQKGQCFVSYVQRSSK